MADATRLIDDLEYAVLARSQGLPGSVEKLSAAKQAIRDALAAPWPFTGSSGPLCVSDADEHDAPDDSGVDVPFAPSDRPEFPFLMMTVSGLLSDAGWSDEAIIKAGFPALYRLANAAAAYALGGVEGLRGYLPANPCPKCGAKRGEPCAGNWMACEGSAAHLERTRGVALPLKDQQ